MSCRWVGVLVLVLAGSARAGDAPPEWITGRVVDDRGDSVAGVDVSPFWNANGETLANIREVQEAGARGEDMARRFQSMGRMEPWGVPTQTGPDGTLRVRSNKRMHHVLAIDADRQRGGLAISPVGQPDAPLTIRLERLTRVQGVIRGPALDEKPEWTVAFVERAEESERPIDAYRLAMCASFNSEFAFLMPPGRYRLQAGDEVANDRVSPWPEIAITGTEPTIDLGTIRFNKMVEGMVPRMNRVRAEKHLKALKDYTDETPPPLFAADARGVPRDWQAGRSPGKWQVIEFWGMGCVVCLERSIPDLMAFQEKHAAQADRFEIVTVFIDIEEKIRTIAQMDEALKPVVQHVWGGQPLTLPTLVDPSYRTAESFGLSGLGEMILINPEGRIVAGDLVTLAQALTAK